MKIPKSIATAIRVVAEPAITGSSLYLVGLASIAQVAADALQGAAIAIGKAGAAIGKHSIIKPVREGAEEFDEYVDKRYDAFRSVTVGTKEGKEEAYTSNLPLHEVIPTK